MPAKKRSSTKKARPEGQGKGPGKRAKLAPKMKKYSKNANQTVNKEKMYTGNHSMNPGWCVYYLHQLSKVA